MPDEEKREEPQPAPDPEPVALQDEAQRALREAKRRYGFPLDAGPES